MSLRPSRAPPPKAAPRARIAGSRLEAVLRAGQAHQTHGARRPADISVIDVDTNVSPVRMHQNYYDKAFAATMEEIEKMRAEWNITPSDALRQFTRNKVKRELEIFLQKKVEERRKALEDERNNERQRQSELANLRKKKAKERRNALEDDEEEDDDDYTAKHPLTKKDISGFAEHIILKELETLKNLKKKNETLKSSLQSYDPYPSYV